MIIFYQTETEMPTSTLMGLIVLFGYLAYHGLGLLVAIVRYFTGIDTRRS